MKKQKNEFFIEREILIGMIVSKEYLQSIRKIWTTRLMRSNAAKKISKWCIEYYDKFQDAPKQHIETLYYQKIQEEKISPDLAETIENQILPSISDDYESDKFNLNYLLDQTRKYFDFSNLEILKDEITILLENGEIEEAEKLIKQFSPINVETSEYADFSNDTILEKIDNAFNESFEYLIEYPGPLGELLNEHLIRGGFVALLAPEKRYKSFMLLDMAMRALKQRCNVAFFQAGDMTENQQIRRVCIYKAKKSDKEKYCGVRPFPVKDCILNQMDECDKKQRECEFGIMENHEIVKFGSEPEKVRKALTREFLLKKFEEYGKEYKPCYNCKNWEKDKLGSVWLTMKDFGMPLKAEEAKKNAKKYFINKKKSMRLSTHPNGSLSVAMMHEILNGWEEEDGFVPDVIIVDYADLLIDTTKEFRHQQNEIWKALRGTSQSKHALVITVTQADAKSYEQDSLKLSNFSEDKRKYAHVTAMWGLNQDSKGREKGLGITRINELVVREGEILPGRQVYILQSIGSGQPFLTSFW